MHWGNPCVQTRSLLAVGGAVPGMRSTARTPKRKNICRRSFGRCARIGAAPILNLMPIFGAPYMADVFRTGGRRALKPTGAGCKRYLRARVLVSFSVVIIRYGPRLDLFMARAVQMTSSG